MRGVLFSSSGGGSAARPENADEGTSYGAYMVGSLNVWLENDNK